MRRFPRRGRILFKHPIRCGKLGGRSRSSGILKSLIKEAGGIGTNIPGESGLSVVRPRGPQTPRSIHREAKHDPPILPLFLPAVTAAGVPRGAIAVGGGHVWGRWRSGTVRPAVRPGAHTPAGRIVRPNFKAGPTGRSHGIECHCQTWGTGGGERGCDDGGAGPLASRRSCRHFWGAPDERHGECGRRRGAGRGSPGKRRLSPMRPAGLREMPTGGRPSRSPLQRPL